jgi:hypothetical protein
VPTGKPDRPTNLDLTGTARVFGLCPQEQVAALERGALGSIISVTSTNALSLTIGVL